MQRRVLMCLLKLGRGDNPEGMGRSFVNLAPISTQVDSHLQRFQKIRIKKKLRNIIS